MLSRVASKCCGTICDEMDFKVVGTEICLAKRDWVCTSLLVGERICVACLTALLVAYDRLLSRVPARTAGVATETPGLDAPLQGRVRGGGRGKGPGVTGQRKDWLKGCCRQV